MREPALPPGPRYGAALTTIGWFTRPGPLMLRARERYGDVFTLRIAHEGPWVVVADPDAVKQIFTGDPRLLHAGEGNVILKPMLGSNSVLLLDEAPHMRQRKLMLPPFHGERMKAYAATMREVTERQVASWPVGEPFALWPRMQAITLEVIVRTVFGVERAGDTERLRKVLEKAIDWGTDPLTAAGLFLFGPEHPLTVRVSRHKLAEVDQVVFEEIARRRSDGNLESREDILSLLLQARHEDGSAMSDEELRDELMTLLVAGHETTATALAWTMERVVRHPHVLERLNADPGDDEYVDAIVKESLRLRPILPIVARRLQEPMEIAGHLIPAGATLAPCIWLMHRRADVYPEPERFRPERFLEQPAGTYTWIPFGGGVRRCLGASFALFEMQTVISAIARLVVMSPASPASEKVRRRAITLVPEKGARVVSRRREGGRQEGGIAGKKAEGGRVAV
ncbi:MAG: cytochrome family [Thermoleophilaceae bacterium]|nr:cytochrome family [Thermoleophilaceae bacterium]